MNFDNLETVIKNNEPKDLWYKWNNWLKELNDLDDTIELIDILNNEESKIISYYYHSVRNTKIYAKLYLPLHEQYENLVFFFHGYMGHSNMPHNIEHVMRWVKEGFAVIAIDIRSQGGLSVDATIEGNVLVHNIDDLENYYSKLIYLDCLRAIDVVKKSNFAYFKDLKELNFIVTGPSQGGQLALATSALSNDVIMCVADVPSGCALNERITHVKGMYASVTDYITKHSKTSDKIIGEQGYFDIVNLAKHIMCPVIASVGLLDEVCPPTYFYQAYKNIKTKKQLNVFDKFGHGGYLEEYFPTVIQFYNEIFHKKCIVAHRGGKGHGLENTRDAFIGALKHNFYGIENDIQRTKDNELIVFHDLDLKRLAKIDKAIIEMTWNELKEIELSKLETDGKIYTGHLLRLSDYLKIVKDKDINSFIEIKETFTKEDIDHLFKLIDGLDNVYIISNMAALPLFSYIRTFNKKIKLQYVANTDYEKNIAFCLEHGIDLDIAYTRLPHNYAYTKNIIDLFHEHGLKVNVWVVNKRQDMFQYLKLGVDYITSDLLR